MEIEGVVFCIFRIMNNLFLKVYDWVHAHRRTGCALLTLVLVVCICLVCRLQFKEEITDFLPVDDQYKQSMKIYQEVASANKVVLLFESELGRDTIIQAVEQFGETLQKVDSIGWIASFEPQIDYSQIMDVTEFVYGHLPYLLDEEDYARVDSLWQTSDFFDERLHWIQQQLTSMSGSFMLPMLQHDPMGLGNRVAAHLKDFQPEMDYMQDNGYLFTPDGQCCIVTIDSPFGSSESQMNGRLIEMLESVAKELPDGIQMRLTGGPVIAAGNAACIQRDTIIAISVSVILILVLILWGFRSLRSLWYIAISTGFGFLIAVAGVSLLGQQMSLIVIGIASIIIGIAVNYPLHFVCHNQEVGDGRKVLSDLVQPLLVGNVTTVAAFLTLVPLEAVAIRQLGLFSALMLVGTILFVLFVLPHLKAVKGVALGSDHTGRPLKGERLITNPVFIILLIVLTLFLGWLSLDTTFDSDISHLNYMTDVQRADMQRLEKMQGQQEGIVVYLPVDQSRMEAYRPVLDSLWKAGLLIDEKNPSYLFPSAAKQEHRLQLWKDFWEKHDYFEFLSQSRTAGFSEEAFEPFLLMIEQENPVLGYGDFDVLTNTILTGYVSPEALVTRLTVADVESAEKVEASLPESFDMKSLNGKIANTLTDNFNYIGFACALIVFIFLWLSFGRIELALLAFTPMAVGWLWILGLMQLFGIQFNIVNIILASFIFGQGDDYTIFITEGLISDYKRGGGHRKLIGYQRSILMSALIMLVGIGSLILARHPAMHSLAEVTIVGMTVVVLMAWILPPMLFHWLIRFDKPLQKYLDERKDI